MTVEAVSPLRRRMIEDMSIRQLGRAPTLRDHLSFIAQSARASRGLGGETDQCNAERYMEPQEVEAMRGGRAQCRLDEEHRPQPQQSETEFQSVRDAADGDEGGEARCDR